MWTKARKSVVFNALLFLLTILVGYSAFNMVRQVSILKKEERANRTKIEELTRKKKELEAYLVELETRDAVEREAKERLNLNVIGESVVVVVPDKSNTSTSGTAPSFFEVIKGFFK